MPFVVTCCREKIALAGPRMTVRGCSSNEQTPVLKLPPDLSVFVFIRYPVVSSRFIEKLVFII